MPTPYLAFGLGNPGPQYRWTRHNIGFLVLDHLVEEHHLVRSHKFNSEYAVYIGSRGPLYLIKPLTYMNLSGQAVAAWVRYFKVPLERIMVVADDVNLPFGALRIRPSGSHGGHNGLRNIIQHLKTDQWPRMRIGIGPKPERLPLERFVLGEFSSQEQKCLPEVIDYAARALMTWHEQGIQAAMNRYNRRRLPEGAC